MTTSLHIGPQCSEKQIMKCIGREGQQVRSWAENTYMTKATVSSSKGKEPEPWEYCWRH